MFPQDFDSKCGSSGEETDSGNDEDSRYLDHDRPVQGKAKLVALTHHRTGHDCRIDRLALLILWFSVECAFECVSYGSASSSGFVRWWSL